MSDEKQVDRKPSKPEQNDNNKKQLPFHSDPNVDTERTSYTEHKKRAY